MTYIPNDPSLIFLAGSRINSFHPFVPFDPINKDNYRDPLIIYFDGAFLEQKASWEVLSRYMGRANHFERWCAICLDKNKNAFLGAHSFSNNAAGLSALGSHLERPI